MSKLKLVVIALLALNSIGCASMARGMGGGIRGMGQGLQQSAARTQNCTTSYYGGYTAYTTCR